jgi:hypothetical protein
MRIRVLPLAVALAAFTSGPVAAQQWGATLSGVVTDTARRPIPDVEIGLLVDRDIVRSVRTRADGRFDLTELPSGKTSFVVRRLGYHPRVYTVQVREGVTRPLLRVVLEPMPAELEKVIVLARVAASNGRLKEFYERKARVGGWGTFIDREEIERQSPTWTSDLLRMTPGVRLIPTHTGNVVRLRGCAPTLWMDGYPLHGAELDQVVFPNEIAGIEVYNSSAGMPVEFTDASGCGAIVVWTRIK